MTLGSSTLSADKQLKFYEITSNMDSYQYECLNKVLGLKAKEFAQANQNIADELAKWIDQYVLRTQRNYCDILKTELAQIQK